MTKICSKCKSEKDISQFGKNKSRKDGLQNWCKECDSAYHSNWFKANRTVQQVRVNRNEEKSNERNYNYICEYLSTHPCIDCGENNILCLQFDHITGQKLFNIGAVVGQAASLQRIIDEIAKCVVRCANCHMVKTSKEGNFARYRWFVQRQDSNLISY